MKTTRDLVVGIGEALWDMLPEGKKLGGAPANFAYHVSQFGLSGMVVSAVGNDQPGREILDTLAAKRLNMLIETLDYPTGTVQVEVDDNGIPRYRIKENVAWDNIPFTDKLKAIAERTTAVCFGSLAQRNRVSRETINNFLALVPNQKGVYKIFDINLRQEFYTKEIICHSLEQCNILKINDEELITVSGMFGYPDTMDFQERCRRLLSDYNLEMLILTCGVNGSYVFTSGDVSFIETPKVTVADTVGAGDSFTASFISALLMKKTVREAHRLAVDVSAFVCTRNGAMPQLPQELISRIV